MKFYDLIRPALFRIDPERAHDMAIALLHDISLSSRVCEDLERVYGFEDPRLGVAMFGKIYPNPFGIAAGFDKNGAIVPALNALGFGFVEIGTVTPQAQTGNNRPRIFRLKEDKALINRMGFPGLGMEVVGENLAQVKGRLKNVGLNLGPNKSSVEAGTADRDCLAVLNYLYQYPDYLVVNVSSPNTAKLRELQGREALHRLLSQVVDVRDSKHEYKPVLVKIAPDLTEGELDAILQVATDIGLDGIVATNTTIDRSMHLRSVNQNQIGGLSGMPLQKRSLASVRRIYSQTGNRLPIIAVGGVFNGYDVLTYIAAGATLVQTYTGFVYQGPSMAKDVKQRMIELLDLRGIDSVMEIQGQSDWA